MRAKQSEPSHTDFALVRFQLTSHNDNFSCYCSPTSQEVAPLQDGSMRMLQACRCFSPLTQIGESAKEAFCTDWCDEGWGRSSEQSLITRSQPLSSAVFLTPPYRHIPNQRICDNCVFDSFSCAAVQHNIQRTQLTFIWLCFGFWGGFFLCIWEYFFY